ncbi:MAG: hypothetical protein Q8Q09_15055 [Deltaproteobacteria bacterium]|nr:hypothetical protein [Deltaproteobacteria bacterium]
MSRRYRADATTIAGIAALESLAALGLLAVAFAPLQSLFATHPRGLEALFDEQARIALEAYLLHSHELTNSLRSATLLLIVYALAVIPLQGLLAARATDHPSIVVGTLERTPALLATAALYASAVAVISLASWSGVIRVLRALDHPDVVPSGPLGALAVLCLAWVVVMFSLRAFVSLARCEVMRGSPTLTAWRSAWNLLTLRTMSLRLAYECVSLLVALLASRAEGPTALFALFATTALRVTAELVWLRTATNTQGTAVSTAQNH